eukprot:s145_g28.t1
MDSDGIERVPWCPAGSLRFKKKSDTDSEKSTSISGRSGRSVPSALPDVPCISLESYPPEAIQVQNTFINIVSPRPETQPLSCPASRIGCLKALFGEDDSPKASPLVKEVKETEDKAMLTLPLPILASKPLEPRPESAPTVIPPVLQCVPMTAPIVPALPALGSEELPSIGSKGHMNEVCKPCAFHHAKGCRNGMMCAFCHLCDRGEKKRRQKVKNARKAAMSRGGA